MPTRIAISLTWHEVLLAASVGTMRQVQNLKNDRKDKYGADPDNAWTPHIEGACGELAVAKYLGVFWNGALGNLGADDVGNFQVRRRTRMDWDLLIQPDDDDNDAFIAIVGKLPKLYICGWMMARDAKRQEWWADKSGKNRPAFFVPQSALRDISELARPLPRSTPEPRT